MPEQTETDSDIPDHARTARALHTALADLRVALVAGSDRTMVRWADVVIRPEFQDSARNLADYLALRRADFSALQAPLAALGLSTLGRAEGHVRASIDAVLASLALIGGAASAHYPAPAAFEAGHALLGARRDALFGGGAGARRTRIMVTLPTAAAEDPALVHRMVAEGADCARINCAHDGPDVWAAMIENVRRAADAAGRAVPVQMDLGGPKLRIEALSSTKKHRLFPGDRFALAERIKKGDNLLTATLTDPVLLTHLKPGAPVWIDDGKLRARVVEAEPCHAVLEVTGAPAKGARIKLEKGVNLPGVDLAIPALTADDLESLDFVVGHADLVAFSFVQTPGDVAALIAAMEARAVPDRPLPGIMLKVETPLAVRNLPELIVAAGGRLPVAVMIARGDLAVEIGFERLSEIQEEILWLCEAARVPVVWATQVLEGLLKQGQATRAETTDAAMGQRAECVMLNKGPYLPEAVAFLSGILTRMDRHQNKKSARLGQLHAWGEI
ncbi:pyruvate kinase [Actibacterium sp. D379-3]